MKSEGITQATNPEGARIEWLEAGFRDSAPTAEFLERTAATAKIAAVLAKMRIEHIKTEDQGFAPAPLFLYLKQLAIWADVQFDGVLEWFGIDEADLKNPRHELTRVYARLGAALSISTEKLWYRFGERMAARRGQPIVLLAQHAAGAAKAFSFDDCYAQLEHAVAGWDEESRSDFMVFREELKAEYERLDP